MNILFVYDDKSVIYQTQKVVGKHNLVLCKYCDLDNLRDEVIDIIIMDFNLKRIAERKYVPILTAKGRWHSPILAILEDKSVENHLAILAMGALECIERPMLDEEYKKKIEEMIRWKWFFEKTI